MAQKQWCIGMRRGSLGLLHFLFLLKEVKVRQAYAALGACNALPMRVQFSWSDLQALPPAGMFIEKLK